MHLVAYYISTALKSLYGRTGVTRDEMAQFEFMFLWALDHGEHGIPNLERHIAENPMSFVQMLAFMFKRGDGEEDPPGWRIEDPERRAGLASAAYHILRRIRHIPGTSADGEIHTEALCTWVDEVRRLCADYGRGEIGDQYIGQLLSGAPAEKDGVWPHPSICEAMERIASPQIGQGFNIGVYNGGGATWRAIDEGGGRRSASLPRNTGAGPSSAPSTTPVSAASSKESHPTTTVRRRGRTTKRK